MARKTLPVADLKEKLNKRIAASDSIEVRRELSALLGNLLMEAGQYRGFGYIGGWTGTEDYRHFYY